MHTGIDIGLNTTAIVTLGDKGKVLYEWQFGSIVNDFLADAIGTHPMKRYSMYLNQFIKYFNTNEVIGTVVMEEPMKLMGKANQLLELKGVYLIGLSSFFKAEKVFLVKPTEMKKFVTGDGAAVKDQVMDSVKKFGYVPLNYDLSDATGLALMSLNGYLFRSKYDK